MSMITYKYNALDAEGQQRHGTIRGADEQDAYRKIVAAGLTPVKLTPVKEGMPLFSFQRVTHSDGEFVRGNVHTNSAEGFWAQVKNAVNGVHHGVAPKYLQHYVNEYAFRYGHRNDVTPMFETLLRRTGKATETNS